MGGSFIQEFPGGSNSYDTLRIRIKAFNPVTQNLNPKLVNHVQVGEEKYLWDMIAPTDIQENISHQWEEYHSVQGRAAQLRNDFLQSLGKLYDVPKSGLSREDGTTDPGLIKRDSPMVYSGSERREYSFTFILMRYRDIANDVINPINWFKFYSSAGIDNAAADTIEFPSIFSVESWPLTFISIPAAILSNVQVTYNAPYISGHPQRAELTLTFRDMKPLYKSSWTDGYEGKILVGNEPAAPGDDQE